MADLELAVFVCGMSIEALTHNTVLHHPDMLRDEAMATLVDEDTSPLSATSGRMPRPHFGCLEHWHEPGHLGCLGPCSQGRLVY